MFESGSSHGWSVADHAEVMGLTTTVKTAIQEQKKSN